MRGARTAVIALALLGLLVPAARAGDLVSRLGEAWRWRAVDPPEGAGALAYLGDAGGAALLGVFQDRIALFDGYRWRTLADLRLPTGRGAFFETVDGGAIGWDSRELFSIDTEGRRRVLARGGSSASKIRAWSLGGTPIVAREGELMRATLDGLETLAPLPDPAAHPAAVDVDAHGRVWASFDRGPMVFDAGSWRAVPLRPALDPHRTFSRIRCEGDRIWFFPSPSDGHDRVYVASRDAKAPVAREAPALSGPVWAALRMPDGSLLLATGAAGVYLVRDQAATRVRLPLALRDQIRGLTLCGPRLVGRTVGGRLYVCDLASRRWTLFAPEAEAAYCNVTAIEPSREGGLWVATSRALYRFRDGRFVRRFDKACGLALRVLTALYEDDRGHLWAGSGASFGGALEFDGTTWRLHDGPAGIDGYAVHAIRPGAPGELWFMLLSRPGTAFEAGGGTARLHNGHWRRFGREEGLEGLRTYDLARAPDGRTWLATRTGLMLLQGDRFRYAEGWNGTPVTRLLVTREGGLWAGRGEFLRRADRTAPVFEERGFPEAAAATDIVEDERGRIWFTAANGLRCYDGGMLHEASSEPGAPVRGVWPIESDKEGGLWLGTNGHGLAHYRPDDGTGPEFTRLVVHTGQASDHVLAHWEARDAWNGTPPDLMRYRWRIDGGGWSAPTHEFEQVFAGLPPGDHSLEVQAIDLAGNVTARPAHRAFRRPAALWTRPAFLIPVCVGAALLAALAFVVFRQRRRSRQAERHAHELIENTGGLLASFDARGRLRYASPRFEALTGRSRDELAADPQRARSLVHPDDREAIATRLEASTGEPHEFRLRDREGRWRWILAAATRRESDGGRDFVALDVTPLHEAQEQRGKLEEHLHETQKLESLGALAGGIAHDFNNLLAAILGNAELAREQVAAHPVLRPALEAIEKAATHASGLTRQMLDYAGDRVAQAAPVDLVALVEDSEALLRSAVVKGAELRIERAAEPVVVEADAAQVRQVLLNLVTNASEALVERGEITVRTGFADQDHARLACLEVRDTGSGMDENVRRRMFDPFFTTKFTGRGLGLAAVRGIVHSHDGRLEVDSAPGGGTVVRVLLPRVDGAAPERPEPVAPARDWRGRGRVLVVDDEQAVREVAVRMLEATGFEVEEAPDGETALERLEARPVGHYAAVLLDLTMPGMGGEECHRRLRVRHAELPVLLMSGYRLEDTPDGRALFIQKPFRVRQLLERMRELLDG